MSSGTKDTCNKGVYIFADSDERFLFAQENPPSSGNFSWNFLTYACYAAPGMYTLCNGLTGLKEQLQPVWEKRGQKYTPLEKIQTKIFM